MRVSGVPFERRLRCPFWPSAWTGCASTYIGAGVAELPPSQVATLENNYPIPYGGVNILEIDGKHRGVGFIHVYELAPGEHSVKYEWTAYGWRLKKGNNTVGLNFRAEPGHRYEVKCDVRTASDHTGWFSSWIEDVQSRKHVSIPADNVDQPALPRPAVK